MPSLEEQEGQCPHFRWETEAGSSIFGDAQRFRRFGRVLTRRMGPWVFQYGYGAEGAERVQEGEEVRKEVRQACSLLCGCCSVTGSGESTVHIFYFSAFHNLTRRHVD